MRVPYQDCFHLIEPLLAKVEKPSRYIDHEWGTLSKADADYRCCMIYPDVYEVGLPNQGIAILYNILNQAEGISCERGYVPWPDMGDAMREAGIPLLSLEGAAPVASFDIVGMHVPHEMAVTNFLEALDLAGIPLLAADRTEDDPIIVAGGPSVYNPEPYAAFFDAILIGEGEESLLEICQLHRRLRDEGVSRAQIVEQLATVAGTYVPSLYEVRHDEPCSPHGYTVPREGKDVPPVVYKRVVEDFGATNPLSQSCVPYAQLVHDRLSIEILRGCARGCRFCQAGMTYRPVRERSADQIVSSVIQGLEKTGYDEVSLTSLSTTDHSCIRDVLGRLNRRLEDTGIRVSIPSQRLDSFGVDMAESVAGEKKGGLTFAPEAGSQRMRDIINKNVTEGDLDRAAKAAFEAGWNRGAQGTPRVYLGVYLCFGVHPQGGNAFPVVPAARLRRRQAPSEAAHHERAQPCRSRALPRCRDLACRGCALPCRSRYDAGHHRCLACGLALRRLGGALLARQLEGGRCQKRHRPQRTGALALRAGLAPALGAREPRLLARLPRARIPPFARGRHDARLHSHVVYRLRNLSHAPRQERIDG